MKILGIDEAGKGCVIGPMIICGAVIIEENMLQLNNMGSLDSKIFTSKKRLNLKKKLDNILDNQLVEVVSASEIDKNNLLQLEIDIISNIICKLLPNIVYIDAPVQPQFISDFVFRIKEKINNKWVGEIIAENKADRNHSIVGAASIIAKLYRDNEIEKIHSCWGNFGSGYPSDKKTIDFLKEWYENNSSFPKHVRKSWSTIKNIMKSDQLTMYDLIGE